jgi:trimethylamine:corrinoid methyltransferase-like protein
VNRTSKGKFPSFVSITCSTSATRITEDAASVHHKVGIHSAVISLTEGQFALDKDQLTALQAILHNLGEATTKDAVKPHRIITHFLGHVDTEPNVSFAIAVGPNFWFANVTNL